MTFLNVAGPSRSGTRRVIPRTRASEAVRSRVQTLQTMRTPRTPSTPVIFLVYYYMLKMPVVICCIMLTDKV